MLRNTETLKNSLWLYREEQERRKAQGMQAAWMRKRTADKVAARCFTKAYLEPLLPNVYEQLTQRGYFYDDVEYGRCSPFSLCTPCNLSHDGKGATSPETNSMFIIFFSRNWGGVPGASSEASSVADSAGKTLSYSRRRHHARGKWTFSSLQPYVPGTQGRQPYSFKHPF